MSHRNTFHPDIHANLLTHLPLDKMAANLADDVFYRIFLNENVWIAIKISLTFLPKGSVDNKPALVEAMAWHRTGEKPCFSIK